MGRPAARGAEVAAADAPAPSSPVENSKIKTPRKRANKVMEQSEREPATPGLAAAIDTPAGVAPLTNALPRTACGGSFSKRTPVFSADGKFIFSTSAYAVRVYSTSTGSLLQTLTGFDDTAVLSVAHNPMNAFQLYVAYKVGRISLWDFNDAVLLKTFELRQPLRHFMLLASGDEAVLVTPNSQRDRRDKASEHERANWRVYVASFKPNLQLNLVARLKDLQSFASDRSGTLMAAVSKRNLYIVRQFNGHHEVISVKHSANLHLVAVNAAENCIAAGDASGSIHMWYLGPDGGAPGAPTAFHWHANALNALSFTVDGTHLLSGGEEGVLVIWQLATRSRNFLPRLGSPILSLACSADGALYALGMSDSSVRLVEATGLVTRHTLVGVRQVLTPTGGSIDFTHGMTLDPRRKTVVLNGLPGGIQFFSPWQDRHMGDVDVLRRNLVTRSDKGAVAFPRIEHVAFSHDGEWMATVDHFDEEGIQLEITLRFWFFDASAQSYVLRTRVDMPHSQRIMALNFHPRLPMVVTAGNDKRFRIWQTETITRKDEAPAVGWTCRSVGFHRDLVLRDAVFSADGSLLAVACGQLITLWDPLQNALQGTLCHAPPDRPILQIAFLARSPYLAARTKSHLYVWNLLSCEVWWCIPLEARHIAAHPTRAAFLAVVTRAADNVSDVIEFSAASAAPVRTWQVRGPAVRSTLYVDDAQFAVVDDAQRIFMAHPETDAFVTGHEAAMSADTVASTASTAGGMLGRIFAPRAVEVQTAQKEEAERPAVAISNKTTYENDGMDAPPHAMPALARIYETFMQNLLAPPLATQATAVEEAAPTMNGHVEDSDDEDAMKTEDVSADRKGTRALTTQKDNVDMNFEFLVKVFQSKTLNGHAEH